MSGDLPARSAAGAWDLSSDINPTYTFLCSLEKTEILTDLRGPLKKSGFTFERTSTDSFVVPTSNGKIYGVLTVAGPGHWKVTLTVTRSYSVPLPVALISGGALVVIIFKCLQAPEGTVPSSDPVAIICVFLFLVTVAWQEKKKFGLRKEVSLLQKTLTEVLGKQS